MQALLVRCGTGYSGRQHHAEPAHQPDHRADRRKRHDRHHDAPDGCVQRKWRADGGFGRRHRLLGRRGGRLRAGTSGIYYIPFGTSGGTQVYSLHGPRVVGIGGGQLYFAYQPSSGIPSGLFTLDTPLPTNSEVAACGSFNCRTATVLANTRQWNRRAIPDELFLPRYGQQRDARHPLRGRRPHTGGQRRRDPAMDATGGVWVLGPTFALSETGVCSAAGMRHVTAVMTGNSVTVIAVAASHLRHEDVPVRGRPHPDREPHAHPARHRDEQHRLSRRLPRAVTLAP